MGGTSRHRDILTLHIHTSWHLWYGRREMGALFTVRLAFVEENYINPLILGCGILLWFNNAKCDIEFLNLVNNVCFILQCRHAFRKEN